MRDRNSGISWPGWETGKLIGQGSFGAVYEIERCVFGQIEKAALKVISIPHNKSDIEELYNDGYDDKSIVNVFEGHVKEIAAEYSLMRKLNGNTNIVNCDDLQYFRHDDDIGWDIFIKMELLTPLTKALPENIPEPMVVKIAKDLCTALDLCKKHNIVHRDIKPQNVFVSDNGDYKLGDFGIAKSVEKTMGGTKIGTYKYMAPEVYYYQPYGHAADIYSLGLVLYWLLNERRMPFVPLPPEILKAGMDEEARMRRLSGEKLPPPAHGSMELKEIVLRACAFDPKDRYASAHEMLNALNQLQYDDFIAIGPATMNSGSVSASKAEDADRTVGPEWDPIYQDKLDIDETTDPGWNYGQQTKGKVENKNNVPGEEDNREKPVPGKEKKKNKFLLIAIVVAIFMIAVVLLGGYFLNNNAGTPVDPPAIDKLEIDSYPTKTDYYIGDALDTSGLKLKVTYNNGTTEVVSSDFTCSPKKFTSAGTSTITVSYKGKTATFAANVSETTVSKIELSANPNTINYYVGDLLNTDGLKLKVTYNNGATEEVNSGFTCSPEKLTSAGTSTITVFYKGKNATFTVNVSETTVSKIEISSTPNTTNYYVGDTLNTSGLKLKVTYNNGATEEVSSGFTCSPEKLTSAGTSTITVSYKGKTATFSVRTSQRQITVSLNANGGTVNQSSITATLGSAYGALPTPRLDYHTFNGWYTAANGGSKVTESTIASSANTTLYAQWTLNPLSQWVLASAVPSGGKVLENKWTYTKTQKTESTNASMSGWTQTGSYWKQTGTGSTLYATFPSGYDTSNTYYKTFAKTGYSAFDNGSTKREVTNTWTGYVYWHWMYDCGNSAADGGFRNIFYKKGSDTSSSIRKGFYYYIFGAFLSTKNYEKQTTGESPNVDVPKGYQWYKVPLSDRQSYADTQGTRFWYRFDYYTSSYTDYQKIYQYQKVTTGIESSTQVTAGGEISNVQHYVRYRAK